MTRFPLHVQLYEEVWPPLGENQQNMSFAHEVAKQQITLLFSLTYPMDQHWH